MVREHPDVAAVLASLVLSEILSVGLFSDDEAGVTAFADAIIQRDLTECRVYTPDPAVVEQHEQRFQIYRRLYPALRDAFFGTSGRSGSSFSAS